MYCSGSQVSHWGRRNMQVIGGRSAGQAESEVLAWARFLKYVRAEAFSCNVCVFVHVCLYVCMYISSVHQRAKKQRHPVAVSASGGQTLVSNVIPPLKGTGCGRTGAASLEHLVTAAKCGNAPRMMRASHRTYVPVCRDSCWPHLGQLEHWLWTGRN